MEVGVRLWLYGQWRAQDAAGVWWPHWTTNSNILRTEDASVYICLSLQLLQIHKTFLVGDWGDITAVTWSVLLPLWREWAYMFRFCTGTEHWHSFSSCEHSHFQAISISDNHHLLHLFMAEESHTESAVFWHAQQTPPSSSSSGSSIFSHSGSQSGSLTTDITSPSHSPKQCGVNAGIRGVSASDEVERYLIEFKNEKVTAADMFVFISSLTEVCHSSWYFSLLTDRRADAISPWEHTLKGIGCTSQCLVTSTTGILHVKTALLENLASPPFEQTLIQNQISIFENWICVLVNGSFAISSDASGHRRQHQWMMLFRALDFL